ncbi:SCP2 domain-containing protein [Frischella sp. Ac48]|uniref:Ubiquinone biosynthesis accessory factor UbiT n=1 Tax=Frischella japonica TaxID=2741544 RepID=A0ABR7QWQ1_9GAMM|nr:MULTISPECIES: SCP2 domain-containing protein [Frischella]MBC9130599.1 SCP2 domain-containing protein [Frischella japonica]MBX4133513.1 SCP2 domain-containing protein [Frischella sp. Ac48]
MLNKIHSMVVENTPFILSKPLQLVPFSLKRKIIEQLLQTQFQQSLEEGDLDFLENRWLKIEVRDLQLVWFISNIDNKLIVSRAEIADVSFSGNMNDLVLIATRRQDPDTLFFQRKLLVEGDTELGLCVKNLMDSIDLDSMPKFVRIGLENLANFIQSSEHKTC